MFTNTWKCVLLLPCKRASVYYTECKPKNKKRGRPGNETSDFSAVVHKIYCSYSQTNNPLVANYNRSKILCNTRYTRPGVYVGELPNLAHSTMGTFYVVDNKTLFIQLFHYDGRGPGKSLWMIAYIIHSKTDPFVH